MTSRRALLRGLSALGVAALLGLAAPLSAEAASPPRAATGTSAATPAPAPTMASTPATALPASYPPASTGTFAVTAHPGTNRVTINGLGKREKATALVSGHGAAPSVDSSAGRRTSRTANLPLGETDARGSISFNLVFAADASGVYNVSVSTPDGRSESGSVTIPSKDGSASWSGATIARWVLWLAGIVVIIGAIALLTNAARRRSSG